jgi:redox-sensitive bicupin YhaK (pirin superfamily)
VPSARATALKLPCSTTSAKRLRSLRSPIGVVGALQTSFNRSTASNDALRLRRYARGRCAYSIPSQSESSLDSVAAYLAVASGRIEINGESMSSLDGAAITQVQAVEITALEDSELVMVDTGKV